MHEKRRWALAVQAAYYIVTGAFPLVSRRAFEALTGPKTDWWLVQTVGLLAVTNGITIGASARVDKPSPEAVALGILSALSLCTIDVTYAAKRRISAIYLADAAIECAFVAVLLATREDR